MLISAFRRWVLGLALLELALARPCLAQADEPDAGRAPEAPAPQQPQTQQPQTLQPQTLQPQTLQPRAEQPLELSWVSAEPSCEGTTVAARALELVTPGITPRPTQARAEVRREGKGWSVDLQTRSESQAGRRVLRGESCKEIQQAIALLLAMILESEAKSAANEAAAPAPEPAVLTPAAAPLDPLLAAMQDGADPEPAPTEPPGPHFGGLVRSDATAALGLKPGLGLGIGLGAALSLGPWELAGGVTYWPTSRASIFGGSGTLEVARQNAAVSACYRFSLGSVLQIVPCIGPELTRYSYLSSDIDETEDGDSKLLVSGTA
ncbi:MAG TPA: hypothetical protein VJU61_12295, partial [Polyangiaceae bacterium]|nr:hypothetical protein [Polyangiaceae bacterium]